MTASRRVATIGTFDGVHLGHRMVLDMVLDIASQRNLKPAVFAFASHPLEVIAPDRVPEKLMDFSAQQKAFAEMKIETFPIHFNEQLRNMTAFDYMKLLRDKYDVQILVIGYDNRFGRDRESGFEDYKNFAGQLGIEVVQAPEMKEVSSSIIRKLLREGRVEEANEKLGYEYSISGIVEHGKELGATIGFPTANLSPDNLRRLVPGDGVYAAKVVLPDGEVCGAMVNIGHRPTICDGRTYRSIEANIFDFSGDIYGKMLTLQFVAFMRKERKMESLDALRDLLMSDRETARKILKSNF